ncbi:hypothetical protein LTR86_006591 [Recurvomyces mirabilis]|nr:hypothetical protein LTR86_006591 [Recurvomyces mirabilis]
MSDHVPETTFKNFSKEQAAQYAAGRGTSYPGPLCQAIMEFHEGKRDVVLDVGTGPGLVVLNMLKYCDRGIGCDASTNMIEQAKKDAATHGMADRTSFSTATAENCSEAVSEAGLSNVDIITVGTAAHWFDMPRFYAAAAKSLRPGGTLAMWCPSSFYVHPSVPHADELQAALSHLEDVYLKPYMQPGSLLARSGYDDLPLPWKTEATSSLFDQKTFKRENWDRNGVPSATPSADGTPAPFLLAQEFSIKAVSMAFASSSPVVRWRQAHPDQALTEEDPVMRTVQVMKDILGEDAKVTAGSSLSLLLLRRN